MTIDTIKIAGTSDEPRPTLNRTARFIDGPADGLQEELDQLGQAFDAERMHGTMLARIAVLEDIVRMQKEQMHGLIGYKSTSGTTYQVQVDKITHRIRFEDHDEESMTIFIEPK